MDQPRYQILLFPPLLPAFLACLALLCWARPLGAQTNIQTGPQAFDSLAKRAAEARDANKLDDAVSLYKQALALRPKWPEGWWSLGTLEYDRNHYVDAARAFRQLLPLAPKDGTAHAMLGLCEFELGQDDVALKHIEEAKNLGVANNDQLRQVVLYHDGILLLRAGQFKLAQDSLESLCRAGQQQEGVLQFLGLALFRVKPADAPPEGSPGALIVKRAGHAACLAAQKKLDEARQEYSALASEYPDYPNVHYAYGRFLVDLNDSPSAVTEFKRELDRHPDNVNARLEIASALYKVDSAAGLPYAQEAVKQHPQQPFGHYLLGLLYLDVDNYQQAIPELEIARNAFSREARIYFALASAYSRAGRKADAEHARAMFRQLSKQASADPKPAY